MTSPRVEIVPFDLTDHDHLAWMFEVRAHPEVTPFFFAPPPTKFQAHVEFLTQSTTRGSRQFYIVLSDTEKCGYCQIIHHLDSYEVGFALHPNWWGKGIGEAAAELLLQHIKRNFEQKKITLVVKAGNQKAINLYKKLGFVIMQQNEDDERCLMGLNYDSYALQIQ